VAVVLEESGQVTEPAVALLGGRAAGLQIARDKEDRSSDPGEIFVLAQAGRLFRAVADG
jgi:hypothetical protein